LAIFYLYEAKSAEMAIKGFRVKTLNDVINSNQCICISASSISTLSPSALPNEDSGTSGKLVREGQTTLATFSCRHFFVTEATMSSTQAGP
jgi:hypothetical protein